MPRLSHILHRGCTLACPLVLCLGVGCKARPTTAGKGAEPDAAAAIRPAGISRYPSLGPADAPVTLALFSGVDDNMRQRYARAAQRRRPRQVRLIWLFNIWPEDLADAKLALAAHRQNAFWRVRRWLGGQRRAAGRPQRCDPLPASASASAALDAQQIARLGLDRARLERDLADPTLEQTLVEQWRIAQALGLTRPQRWQGTDFLLVNGRRLLPRRPGFTPAQRATSRLERMIDEELERAGRLRQRGMPDHRLHRLLARQNGAQRYLEHVVNARPPAPAVVVLLDPRLPPAQRAVLAATTARAHRLLARPLALRLVGPETQEVRLGPPQPPVPAQEPWQSPPVGWARRALPPLASALRQLVARRDLARDFFGWRRLLLLADAPDESPDLRIALFHARENRFSVTVIVRRPWPAELRARVSRWAGVAVRQTDEASFAEVLLAELARTRTRTPVGGAVARAQSSR